MTISAFYIYLNGEMRVHPELKLPLKSPATLMELLFLAMKAMLRNQSKQVTVLLHFQMQRVENVIISFM